MQYWIFPLIGFVGLTWNKNTNLFEIIDFKKSFLYSDKTNIHNILMNKKNEKYNLNQIHKSVESSFTFPIQQEPNKKTQESYQNDLYEYYFMAKSELEQKLSKLNYYGNQPTKFSIPNSQVYEKNSLVSVSLASAELMPLLLSQRLLNSFLWSKSGTIEIDSFFLNNKFNLKNQRNNILTTDLNFSHSNTYKEKGNFFINTNLKNIVPTLTSNIREIYKKSPKKLLPISMYYKNLNNSKTQRNKIKKNTLFSIIEMPNTFCIKPISQKQKGILHNHPIRSYEKAKILLDNAIKNSLLKETNNKDKNFKNIISSALASVSRSEVMHSLDKLKNQSYFINKNLTKSKLLFDFSILKSSQQNRNFSKSKILSNLFFASLSRSFGEAEKQGEHFFRSLRLRRCEGIGSFASAPFSFARFGCADAKAPSRSEKRRKPRSEKRTEAEETEAFASAQPKRAKEAEKQKSNFLNTQNNKIKENDIFVKKISEKLKFDLDKLLFLKRFKKNFILFNKKNNLQNKKTNLKFLFLLHSNFKNTNNIFKKFKKIKGSMPSIKENNMKNYIYELSVLNYWKKSLNLLNLNNNKISYSSKFCKKDRLFASFATLLESSIPNLQTGGIEDNSQSLIGASSSLVSRFRSQSEGAEASKGAEMKNQSKSLRSRSKRSEGAFAREARQKKRAKGNEREEEFFNKFAKIQKFLNRYSKDSSLLTFQTSNLNPIKLKNSILTSDLFYKDNLNILSNKFIYNKEQNLVYNYHLYSYNRNSKENYINKNFYRKNKKVLGKFMYKSIMSKMNDFNKNLITNERLGKKFKNKKFKTFSESKISKNKEQNYINFILNLKQISFMNLNYFYNKLYMLIDNLYKILSYDLTKKTTFLETNINNIKIVKSNIQKKLIKKNNFKVVGFASRAKEKLDLNSKTFNKNFRKNKKEKIFRTLLSYKFSKANFKNIKLKKNIISDTLPLPSSLPRSSVSSASVCFGSSVSRSEEPRSERVEAKELMPSLRERSEEPSHWLLLRFREAKSREARNERRAKQEEKKIANRFASALPKKIQTKLKKRMRNLLSIYSNNIQYKYYKKNTFKKLNSLNLPPFFSQSVIVNKTRFEKKEKHYKNNISLNRILRRIGFVFLSELKIKKNYSQNRKHKISFASRLSFLRFGSSASAEPMPSLSRSEGIGSAEAEESERAFASRAKEETEAKKMRSERSEGAEARSEQKGKAKLGFMDLNKKESLIQRFEKEKSLQKRRRRKKLKLETRRRKKRKRFYPRTVWLRYSLYKKFLNFRHSYNNFYYRKKVFASCLGSSLSSAKPRSEGFLRFGSSVSLAKPRSEEPRSERAEVKEETKAKEPMQSLRSLHKRKAEEQKGANSYQFFNNNKLSVYVSQKNEKVVYISNFFLKNQKLKNKIYRNNKQKWGNFIQDTPQFEKISLKKINFFQHFPVFQNKEYYKVSGRILAEFQPLCWKSYWLRSNLTPYMNRIEKNFSFMKQVEKTNNISNINTFLYKIFGFFSYDFYSFKFKMLPFYTDFKNSFDNQHAFYLSNLFFQESTNKIAEYNRIEFERFSEILKNVKFNMNLEGQLKPKSYKFIAWKYLFSSSASFASASPKRATELKTFNRKNFWYRLSYNMNPNFSSVSPFVILSNTFSKNSASIKPYGSSGTLRALWTFNKTNIFTFKEKNQICNLWEQTKLREQLKSNQTKKFLMNLIKVQDNLYLKDIFYNSFLSKEPSATQLFARFGSSFASAPSSVSRSETEEGAKAKEKTEAEERSEKRTATTKKSANFKNFKNLNSMNFSTVKKLQTAQKKLVLMSLFQQKSQKNSSNYILKNTNNISYNYYIRLLKSKISNSPIFRSASFARKKANTKLNTKKNLTHSTLKTNNFVFSYTLKNKKNSPFINIAKPRLLKPSSYFWWSSKNFQMPLNLNMFNDSYTSLFFLSESKIPNNLQFKTIYDYSESSNKKEISNIPIAQQQKTNKLIVSALSLSRSEGIGSAEAEEPKRSEGEAKASSLTKQNILIFSILFHLSILFSFIRIPELRGLLKFQILLFYKISNSYFIILYSIYDLLKKYKKETLKTYNSLYEKTYKLLSYINILDVESQSLHSFHSFGNSDYPGLNFGKGTKKILFPRVFDLSSTSACERSERNRSLFRFLRSPRLPSSHLGFAEAKKPRSERSEGAFAKREAKPKRAQEEGANAKNQSALKYPKIYNKDLKSYNENNRNNLSSRNLSKSFTTYITSQTPFIYSFSYNIVEFLYTKKILNKILSLALVSAASVSSFAHFGEADAKASAPSSAKPRSEKLKPKKTKPKRDKRSQTSIENTKFKKNLYQKSDLQILKLDIKKNSMTELYKRFMSFRNIQTYFALFFLYFSYGFVHLSIGLFESTYQFLLKIIDLFESFLLIIYKFLEKPAELMIEWIAQIFLIEWSSDPSSFIPETFDMYFWYSFQKFFRNTRILGFVEFQNSTNIYNIMNSLELSGSLFARFGFANAKASPKLHQSKAESMFSFSISNILGFFMQRRLWNFFHLFIDSMLKPDIDLIVRQKKGKIFWDIWADILIRAAEQYNINIPSLTSLKEEQEKLIERLIQDPAFINFSILNSDYKNNISSPLPNNFNFKNKSKISNIFYNKNVLKNFYKTKSWSSNQYVTFNLKDTDLFLDMSPPKSLLYVHFINGYEPIQYTLGSIMCEIYSGLFSHKVSKNLLIVNSHVADLPLRSAISSNFLNSAKSSFDFQSRGSYGSLIIQALAGESEMKMMIDNANRYASVQRGVAVGMKLLRDVFESIVLQTPCFFLMEDLHVIGERRPMLISDDENSYEKEFSIFGFEQDEESEKNQMIYQSSRHSINDFRRPYKGDFSMLIPTNLYNKNLYSFKTFLNNTKPTHQKKYPISLPSLHDKIENKMSSLREDQSYDKNKQNNFSQSFNISRLQIASENFFAPPATSPFTILMMKQQRKLKPKKIARSAKQISWNSFVAENIIASKNDSIRAKVAILADMTLRNFSYNKDMITDLLVIIDGVRSNRGFVVFATTHLPSILDPALRRPGRFDETISLPLLPNLMNRWSLFQMHFGTTLLYSASERKKILQKKFLPLYGNARRAFTSPLVLLGSSLCETGEPKRAQETFDRFDYGILTENFNFSQISNLISKAKLSCNVNYNSAKSPIIHPNQALQSFFIEKDYRSFSASSACFSPWLPSSRLGFAEAKKPRSERSEEAFPSFAREAKAPSLRRSRGEKRRQPKRAKEELKQAKEEVSLHIEHSERKNVNKIIPFNSSNKNFKKIYSQISFGYFQIGNLLISSDFLKDQTYFSLYNKSLILEQSSPFVFHTLYSSLNTFKMFIMRLLGGKIAEFLVSKNQRNLYNSFTSSMPAPFALAPSSFARFSPRLLRFGEAEARSERSKKQRQPRSEKRKKHNGLNFSITDHMIRYKSWHFATSLIFSILQKRFLYNKNLIITKMLSFDNPNQSSLREPPSPPASSLLMPSKKYENFKRIEHDFQQKATFSIYEKMQMHQKQRFLKRLYNKPVLESFKSQLFENRLTSFESSFKEFSYNKDSNLLKLSSSHSYYKNRLNIRHRFSLINQWWNGQLAEHNVEVTYLSDIDWRTMYIQSFASSPSAPTNQSEGIGCADAFASAQPMRAKKPSSQRSLRIGAAEASASLNHQSFIDDLNNKPSYEKLCLKESKSILSYSKTSNKTDSMLDFPDADQHYNPRIRRWFLNANSWNYWLNFENTFYYEIYSHMIYDIFNKTSLYFNQNRELLDFFVYTYNIKGSLKEIDLIFILSRFYRK